jgi:hypothetical protein
MMLKLMHLKKKTKKKKLYNEPNPKLKFTKQICANVERRRTFSDFHNQHWLMGCISCEMGFVGNFNVNGILFIVYQT